MSQSSILQIEDREKVSYFELEKITVETKEEKGLVSSQNSDL